MLPEVAEKLGLSATNKEGWVSGLLSRVLRDKTGEPELGICFPIPDNQKKMCGSEDAEGRELFCGTLDGFAYYGFIEDTVNLHFYDFKVERQIEEIFQDFKPDVVHIFGTEYPHALAAAKAWKRPERTLVGLQGIVRSCAEAYYAELPERIIKRHTLRDWLKGDSILEQQEKFVIRAEHEEQLLRLAGHVTGRTDFDRAEAERMHPGVSYHFMNETLRSVFYEGDSWSPQQCKRHSIFVSQGNYPLKGLHKVIEALPIVREVYPDVTIAVAGDRITANKTIKDKIKLSSYGKYLLELLDNYQCRDAVQFLGKQDAGQVKKELLQANVFVSASSVENSSNSVGEAMLLGVPVVASHVGGLPSMISDGEEGLFYEFSDTNALAKRVMRIFEDDGLACRLSEKARARALSVHEPEKNYTRLLEIYREVLNV